MIKVIVNHFTKSDEDTDLLMGIIKQLGNEAIKQTGYITGRTLVNVTDPSNVLAISTWDKKESWDAWDTSETCAGITKQVLPLLKRPYTVSIYDFAMTRVGRVSSIF